LIERFDVAVVGGGPTGLLSALEASRRGAKVVVFEEDDEVGVPAHCAGLVSIKGLRALSIKGNYVQGYIRGARVYSPSGEHLEIKADRNLAYVIDRVEFDKSIADLALRAGAELRCKAKVDRLMWSKARVSGVKVKERGCGEYYIKSGVIIDAEGARCKVLRRAGMPTPDLELMYPAVQVEVSEDLDLEDDVVEIYLGSEWAPGFFAWIIPHNEGGRVGLAAKNVALNKMLRKFMTRHPIASRRLRGVKVDKYMGGTLVLGGPAPITHRAGLIVVGDAAGQTKPTTGGGVVFGGISAKIAGEEAARAALEGDERAFKRYEERWRGLLEGELLWMKMFRKRLSSMTDGELDFVIRLSNRLKLDKELTLKGDMDFHFLTARNLMLSLRALPLMSRFLDTIILGLALKKLR